MEREAEAEFSPLAAISAKVTGPLPVGAVVSGVDEMGPVVMAVVVVWARQASSSAVGALLANCAVVGGGGETQKMSGKGVTGIMAGGGGLRAPEGEGVDISSLRLLRYRP